MSKVMINWITGGEMVVQDDQVELFLSRGHKLAGKKEKPAEPPKKSRTRRTAK